MATSKLVWPVTYFVQLDEIVPVKESQVTALNLEGLMRIAPKITTRVTLQICFFNEESNEPDSL
jgi:hypothetical protein